MNNLNSYGTIEQLEQNTDEIIRASQEQRFRLEELMDKHQRQTETMRGLFAKRPVEVPFSESLNNRVNLMKDDLAILWRNIVETLSKGGQYILKGIAAIILIAAVIFGAHYIFERTISPY